MTGLLQRRVINFQPGVFQPHALVGVYQRILQVSSVNYLYFRLLTCYMNLL